MNEQQFFNVAFAIIGALGGWWMRVMWQSLKELEQQDSKLADKVQYRSSCSRAVRQARRYEPRHYHNIRKA